MKLVLSHKNKEMSLATVIYNVVLLESVGISKKRNH